MKIRHVEDLQVYAQVVDSGTLVGAGRVLGLSPTLVSRRLARLERALGVRLLERTTRSLRVTDEGRTFYARCQRVLTDLDLAEEELQPAFSAVSGLVRLVLPTSMLPYGIMDSLKDLLQAHPKLSVQIELTDHSVDLLGGGWDIATHIGTPNDSSHIGRRLGTVSPRLAAHPDYLAREGTPEHPSDLSNHQCIRMAINQAVTHWPIIDEDGTTHRVPVGGRLICHDIITLYSAVCAGMGIGYLPKAALRKAQQEGLLTEILPGCQIESASLYALVPAGRQGLPRIQVVVAWLADFLDQLDQEGG
jgi:DNA-binding transcriptional LysR family regulator